MTAASNGCQLGNGVKHVVQITFDNVHFFQDNPNVPSDLQLMPNLLNFFENNGTFLSNNHTPLIAHTADDILTTYTGLYGDRQGMPISNSYRVYQANGAGGALGTTDGAGSFAYWTDPVYDTSPTATDTNPSMVYSPVPPATAKNPVSPTTHHPGAVGAVHPGGLRRRQRRYPRELRAREHRRGHPQGVRRRLARGPAAHQRPRLLQGPGGGGLHGHRGALRPGSAFCADATGTKYGQSSPTSTAVRRPAP